MFSIAIAAALPVQIRHSIRVSCREGGAEMVTQLRITTPAAPPSRRCSVLTPSRNIPLPFIFPFGAADKFALCANFVHTSMLCAIIDAGKSDDAQMTELEDLQFS